MLEIESKFDLLDSRADAFSRVLDWLKDSKYQIRTISTDHDIEDTYFDTKDFKIERLPGSLRLRRTTDQCLLTLKLKVASDQAVLSRIELEAPPSAEHFERVYLALTDAGCLGMVDVIKRDIAPEEILTRWGFQPILVVQNERSTYAILKDAGECCTLTHDSVDFRQHDRTVYYNGIEIEASDPDAYHDVAALSLELLQAFPDLLKPQSASKYELGLRLLDLR
jgi:inorganic triphosphatase YgiF